MTCGGRDAGKGVFQTGLGRLSSALAKLIPGALDRPQCRLSILRNGNVPCFEMFMSILEEPNVTCRI